MKFLINLLIFVGLALLILIFAPILGQEAKYQMEQMTNVKYVLTDEQLNTFEKPLMPPDTEFSLVIPKIGATSTVVQNVDSQNQKEYLKALKKGVAHALGTATPGGDGNVFLFAHSTDAFYNVGRYNAVFYLIGKLKSNDEIYVYYKGDRFKYLVTETKVVEASDVQYLDIQSNDKTLTLQTCYPPGTTFKRLVVVAKQVTE